MPEYFWFKGESVEDYKERSVLEGALRKQFVQDVLK